MANTIAKHSRRDWRLEYVGNAKANKLVSIALDRVEVALAHALR